MSDSKTPIQRALEIADCEEYSGDMRLVALRFHGALRVLAKALRESNRPDVAWRTKELEAEVDAQRQQIEHLQKATAEMSSWIRQSIRANQDLDSYLRTICDLPDDYGTPLDGVRMAINSLRSSNPQ